MPSASGDSSSGGPQHLGADSFDCRPERYEIVVQYYITEAILVISAENIIDDYHEKMFTLERYHAAR